MSYAVIESGGKQYKVEPGDWIKVEKLDSQEGSLVEINNVLAVSQNNETLIGNPTVEGARVIATVAAHGKDKKIIVFKFKAKNRYRRKQGHRQNYTQLNIQEILTGAKEAPKVTAEAAKVTEEAPKATKGTSKGAKATKPSKAKSKSTSKKVS